MSRRPVAVATTERTLPHDLDAERSVLGAVLVDNRFMLPVLDVLSDADFYRDAHRRIFQVLESMHARGAAMDFVTVKDELARAGELEEIGGPSYLAELANGLPRSVNAAAYAGIVREKAQLRNVIHVSTLAREQAYAQEGTAAEVVAATQGRLTTCVDVQAGEEVSAHGLNVVCMADVERKPLRFLWPGRIARGKLSLIVGDPGLGKSFVSLDIVARCSSGAPWPDGDGGSAPSCSALLLMLEDDLSDTVGPRLDQLGAQGSRVHALQAVRTGDSERQFSLSLDIPKLDQYLAAHPEIGVIVIDPLNGYLGGVDSYKDADVRSVLSPLKTLAEKFDVAIVGIMHLGKSGQKPAIYRVLGSIGFVAAARLVMAVAEHPAGDGRRVFAPAKQNNIGAPAALAFRIDDAGFRWEGRIDDVNLDEVLGGQSVYERQERQDAEEWLRELLTDDNGLPAKDVQAAARNAGIGWRSVESAKSKLRVQSVKVGAGTAGRWVWKLPLKTADPVSTLRPCGLAAFEENPNVLSDFSKAAKAARPQAREEAGASLLGSVSQPVEIVGDEDVANF